MIKWKFEKASDVKIFSKFGIPKDGSRYGVLPPMIKKVKND